MTGEKSSNGFDCLRWNARIVTLTITGCYDSKDAKPRGALSSMVTILITHNHHHQTVHMRERKRTEIRKCTAQTRHERYALSKKRQEPWSGYCSELITALPVRNSPLLRKPTGHYEMTKESHPTLSPESAESVWSPLRSPLMTWLILFANIRMQTHTNKICRPNGKLRCWNIRRHVPGSLWQLRCYTPFIRIFRMAQKIPRQLAAYVNLI